MQSSKHNKEDSFDKRLAQLQKKFVNYPGNFIVRGSFARGDALCNDVDIAVYNYGGQVDLEELPKIFQGIKINYWVVPLEELENYYEICIRPSISLVETKILKITDPEALEIIDRQKTRFYQYRANKYLLYVLLEEEATCRVCDKILEDSYSFRKRRRGSKRTISRVVWAAKALFPELENMNTSQVMAELCQRGIMPQDIREASEKVLRMLFEKKIDEKEWETLTGKINFWYQNYFKVFVLDQLKDKLAEDLIANVLMTVNDDATQNELERAFGYAKKLDPSPEKWMLYFGLSGNMQLKPSRLGEIFEAVGDSIVYNNIVRNLIMNVNFPEKRIPWELVEKNSLYKRAYEIRNKMMAKIGT